MNRKNASDAKAFLASLKQGIWVLCIPIWLFGALERSATALSDQAVSSSDLIQVFTAVFFLMGWLLLKPTHRFMNHSAEG